MKPTGMMRIVALLFFALNGVFVFAESERSRISQVAEMDLRKAPIDFKNRLLATEKEMQGKGGFVVAGKVEIEKAAPPKPGEYAVALRFDKSNAEDTYKHPGGWFISRVIPKNRTYQTTLVVATYRELPVESALTLDEGKVNWVIATLQKTTPREQAIISGKVIDELGKPVAKAKVSLNLYRSNGTFGNGSSGVLLKLSDAKGEYSFDGVTSQDYSLTVHHDQYSSDMAILTMPDSSGDSMTKSGSSGEETKGQGPYSLKMTRIFAKQGRQELASKDATMILGKLRAITIDYEYSLGNYFTGDVVNKGVVWRDKPADFSQMKFSSGTVYVEQSTSNDDLCLINKEGGSFFVHRYFGLQENGHYDFGEVSFESVDKIDETKAYKSRNEHTPCLLNHVYGVKTYDGKYAKFVVRKIELLSDFEKSNTSKKRRP